MTKDHTKVYLFIDEDPQPLAELSTPIVFDLDTRKLTDGAHVLKIVSRAPSGKEGVRKVPFMVANGPSISIEGLKDEEVVDGVLPIMINAYDRGNQKSFVITGSETPRTIPFWVWVVVMLFVAWAIYYEITSANMP